MAAIHSRVIRFELPSRLDCPAAIASGPARILPFEAAPLYAEDLGAGFRVEIRRAGSGVDLLATRNGARIPGLRGEWPTHYDTIQEAMLEIAAWRKILVLFSGSWRGLA